MSETQCGNFRIFTATLILREINFGHIAALNLAFFGIFYILKCEIPQKSKFLTF